MMEATLGPAVVAKVEVMTGVRAVARMEAMSGAVVVVVVAMMVVLGVAAKGTMPAVVVARLLPEVGRSIVIIVTLFLSLLNHRQHRTLQLIQLGAYLSSVVCK